MSAAPKKNTMRTYFTNVSIQEQEKKELPDNGNAKNFTEFIKAEEKKTIRQLIYDAPMVNDFSIAESNIILRFNYDDYHLFFRYLEYLMKREDPLFRKHMKWIGENLNYEELLEIHSVYPQIEIDVFQLVYTNDKGKIILFKFFNE